MASLGTTVPFLGALHMEWQMSTLYQIKVLINCLVAAQHVSTGVAGGQLRAKSVSLGEQHMLTHRHYTSQS